MTAPSSPNVASRASRAIAAASARFRPSRSAFQATARYIAPVSMCRYPSQRAMVRAIVPLPAPEGPSIAMISCLVAIKGRPARIFYYWRNVRAACRVGARRRRPGAGRARVRDGALRAQRRLRRRCRRCRRVVAYPAADPRARRHHPRPRHPDQTRSDSLATLRTRRRAARQSHRVSGHPRGRSGRTETHDVRAAAGGQRRPDRDRAAARSSRVSHQDGVDGCDRRHRPRDGRQFRHRDERPGGSGRHQLRGRSGTRRCRPALRCATN